MILKNGRIMFKLYFTVLVTALILQGCAKTDGTQSVNSIFPSSIAADAQ